MNFPILKILLLAAAVVGILLLKRSSLEGKIILVFALLAFSAWVRLRFALLLFTSLSLVSFVIVAIVWAWIASARLKLKRQIKDEAHAGENVPVNYKVSTRAVLPLYHVRVWDRTYRERADGTSEEQPFDDPGYVSFLRLKTGEESDGLQHFVPPVRGKYNFGPVAVEGGDPFGIFTFTRWLPVNDECLVLPTWIRLTSLPSIPARLGAREQEHLVPREGQSHEFLGTREWTEGDSLRKVHWPLSARHDTLIVKQFQRLVEEEMLVVLDADRCADIGEGAENALEYLITMSLSLIHAANELGRPWTFIIAAEKNSVLNNNSKEALLAAQYLLAMLETRRDDPIESQLADIRRQYQSAAIVLLTARTDPEPGLVMSSGDLQTGGGARSLLVRVDTSTFVPTSGEGIAKLKKFREAVPLKTSKIHEFKGAATVNELVISRGDNIAELFLSRALT